MNGASGFQKALSFFSHHHRLGSCISNGIHSEQAHGTTSMLTIPSPFPQPQKKAREDLGTIFRSHGAQRSPQRQPSLAYIGMAHGLLPV